MNDEPERSVLERYEPFVFALLLLGLALIYVIQSFGFGRSARILPQVLGFPLLGLLAAQTAIETRRLVTARSARRSPERVDSSKPRAKPRAIGGELEHEEYIRSQSAAFVWVGLALAAFLAFGIWVGGAAFIIALARWCGERWRPSILLAAGVIGSLYVIFAQIIGVSVYTGLVTDLVLGWVAR